jgi:alpha-D-ribose 1-methylphosphonate 5-triphosphate synthase subunit PhnL
VKRTRLILREVSKAFTLHLRDGLRLPVVNEVALALAAGECVALAGPSGVGKSTILRMIYGNYRVDAGQILVVDGDATLDLATIPPRSILALRRTTIGYVSQFLRAVPRVPALDIIAEPLRLRGVEAEEARRRAGALLARLSIPERLWNVPPATFSGGEQQRVNIARGLIADFPILLLDEPTASLDAVNCDVVAALIEEKRVAGAAILAIVHDPRIRARLASREVDVADFAAA